jgi:hypothetical protein
MMGGFAAHHKRLLTEFKPGSPKADYRDRRLCASPEIQTVDLDGNKRSIGDNVDYQLEPRFASTGRR